MLHLLLFDRSKFFRVEEQRPISHGGHRLVGLVTLNLVLRSGSEDCGVSLHVTKFGLSRDPGFVVFFQLEFTSMLSRTPPPALPFSPLS